MRIRQFNQRYQRVNVSGGMTEKGFNKIIGNHYCHYSRILEGVELDLFGVFSVFLGSPPSGPLPRGLRGRQREKSTGVTDGLI